jgi:hypothetical protein
MPRMDSGSRGSRRGEGSYKKLPSFTRTHRSNLPSFAHAPPSTNSAPTSANDTTNTNWGEGGSWGDVDTTSTSWDDDGTTSTTNTSWGKAHQAQTASPFGEFICITESLNILYVLYRLWISRFPTWREGSQELAVIYSYSPVAPTVVYSCSPLYELLVRLQL